MLLIRYHWTNQTLRDDYKNYLSTTKGLALIWWANRDRFMLFPLNSTGHYKLHEGKENSFPSYFTIVLRRQFLYNELWARQCRLYWEMGLPRKWANMENSKLKAVTQQQLDAQDNPPKPESRPEAIRLEHIYGPLSFLAAMLTIAIICFICIEQVEAIKKVMKTISQFP